MNTPTIQERIAKVRDEADIVDVVGRAVRLSRASQPRGKCPFHGSKSDSFAVYPASGRAQCWGCDWKGDAIDFVRDHYGLSFLDALARLESDLGIIAGPGTGGLRSAPAVRQKTAREWRPPETVPSAVVAKYLWDLAKPDSDALRVWLRARKVPEAMLTDHWLGQLRFCESAPIAAWPKGKGPDAVGHAPAMVALIRKIVELDGQRRFKACGVHATYLSPGLRAKMNRKRGNGSEVPPRKMYGESAGGVVLLGDYTPDCPLYVGEGIETVLSGMAIRDAGEDACGLAVLSLKNMQGEAKRWKNGVLPLFDVRPDMESACVCFRHDGPVVGLVDADMKPLRGVLVRGPQAPGATHPGRLASAPVGATAGRPCGPDGAEGEGTKGRDGPAEPKQYAGIKLVERRGGPIVQRAITSAERSMICAKLFVERWRDAGCRRVDAIRPRMGLDFNDAAREVA